MTQISNKLRITTLAVLFTFCSMIMASSGAFAAPVPAPARARAANGASTLINVVDSLGNSFAGVLTLTSFTNTGTQIVANGVLNGTKTISGITTAVTNVAVSLPLLAASASCPILSLTLGPLDLNLLGLQVTLNQVVLNITAIPGPGHLLGNLLCDVANLLNGSNLSGLLGTLATDLNNILTALGL
jgi:hypothetical protein